MRFRLLTRESDFAEVLAVAKMWKLPLGIDLRPFEKEVAVTPELLRRTSRAIKQKLEDSDPYLAKPGSTRCSVNQQSRSSSRYCGHIQNQTHK